MFKKIFHFRRFSFFDTVMIAVGSGLLGSARWGEYFIAMCVWAVTRIAVDAYYRKKA